jgi:hypothetical protein
MRLLLAKMLACVSGLLILFLAMIFAMLQNQ